MAPCRFPGARAAPLLVLAAACLAPSVVAQAQLDVAICAAAAADANACAFRQTQNSLLATGLFNSVDVINVTATGTGTPTLAQLSTYDALLCWTAFTPADNAAWGDVLADYVDAGGGVVVAPYANSSNAAGLNIGGRWQSGYEVILDQSGTHSGPAFLGLVHVPAHPVMSGVSSFYGGVGSFRPEGTAVAPGAIVVAEWSDGRLLVVQGANPRRVDLGFYPPSSACFGGGWDLYTDGTKLLANSLVAVATAPCAPPPVVYCTAGATSHGCVASISAAGTASASAGSGFTVNVAHVEGAQPGVLFYGLSGAQAAAWGAGTSYLCIKAPTQRLPTQLSGGTTSQCDGSLAADWNAYVASTPGALGAPFAAGQTVWMQGWFRDPASPKTTSLSDALRFVTCP